MQQYLRYVQSKYGKCTIVFHGYSSGPSTKHHEYQRRKVAKGEQIININIQVHESQNAFLSNDHSKKEFEHLSKYLISAGYSVLQSKEDADTLILSTATDTAILGKNVIVVADGSDVLIFPYN